MDEKIKALWANNKIIFIILLPLIALWFFHSLIFSLLVGNARKVTSEAKAQDEVLKSESDQVAVQAAVEETKAQDLDKKVQERTENDVSEDWNKKK